LASGWVGQYLLTRFKLRVRQRSLGLGQRRGHLARTRPVRHVTSLLPGRAAVVSLCGWPRARSASGCVHAAVAWLCLALVGSVAVTPARTPDPASGQSRPVVVTRSPGSTLAALPLWSHSSGGRGSHLPHAPSSFALPLLSLAFGRSLLPRERAPGAQSRALPPWPPFVMSHQPCAVFARPNRQLRASSPIPRAST
jgi:hypothetical protein